METPAAATFLAWLVGVPAALLFGVLGVLALAFGGIHGTVGLVSGAVLALAGGAAGASLVGVCALAIGVDLGPRFSYPFAVTPGGCLSVLLLGLAESSIGGGAGKEAGWLRAEGGALLVIATAAVVGAVLARCIRGYGRSSRTCARLMAVALLPVGAVLCFQGFGAEEVFGEGFPFFVIGALLVAVLGGVLGALCGALYDAVRGLFGRRGGQAQDPSAP